jgi:hypothetical protein
MLSIVSFIMSGVPQPIGDRTRQKIKMINESFFMIFSLS